MSAPCTILASLPSFCQQLSKLVKIWRSSDKKKQICSTVFFETRCRHSYRCKVHCALRTDRTEDKDGAEEADSVVIGVTWQTIKWQQVWRPSRLASHVDPGGLTDCAQVIGWRSAQQADYHIQLKHTNHHTTLCYYSVIGSCLKKLIRITRYAIIYKHCYHLVSLSPGADNHLTDDRGLQIQSIWTLHCSKSVK